MSTFSRICMWLGGFLLVAGGVYGFTSHEPAGTTLLLVASVTFWFLALVARHVARQASAQPDQEEPELHIAPTIWRSTDRPAQPCAIRIATASTMLTTTTRNTVP